MNELNGILELLCFFGLFLPERTQDLSVSLNFRVVFMLCVFFINKVYVSQCFQLVWLILVSRYSVS